RPPMFAGPTERQASSLNALASGVSRDAGATGTAAAAREAVRAMAIRPRMSGTAAGLGTEKHRLGRRMRGTLLGERAPKIARAAASSAGAGPEPAHVEEGRLAGLPLPRAQHPKDRHVVALEP